MNTWKLTVFFIIICVAMTYTLTFYNWLPWKYLKQKNQVINFYSKITGNFNDFVYFNGKEWSRGYTNERPLLFENKKYVPKLYEKSKVSNKKKFIVVYGDNKPNLNNEFSKCKLASNCELSFNRNEWRKADILIITDSLVPNSERPPGQVWILYLLESPYHSGIDNRLADKLNFTATYRLDSTIWTPYGYYEPYNTTYISSIRKNSSKQINYADGKSKLVAWFVSNCLPHSPRMEYATSLSKYIEVDIYGSCGKRQCPRHKPGCFSMLRKDYKFYLSFENSLCKDYVTEKFFRNALMNNVLPIVMGASREEYERVGPPNSFIHVDDFESPKELAKYLIYLNENDTAYNEYFEWHQHGLIHSWDTKPECDICLFVNIAPYLKQSWYSDVSEWWNKGCHDRRPKWLSYLN